MTAQMLVLVQGDIAEYERITMKTILRSPPRAASGFYLLLLVGTMFSQLQAQVQYASFSATVFDGRRVLLEWETTQEGTNYGFYVQRRYQTDTSFTNISGLVPGAGTSATPRYYS